MAEISKVRFGGVDYGIKSITDTSLSEGGTPADAVAVANERKRTIVLPGAAGVTFSGNTTQEDSLIVNVPLYYYVNVSSGDAFISKTGGTYTIGHNQVLVFDVNTHELSVKASNVELNNTDIILVWKQVTAIKGAWSFYYQSSINIDYEIALGAAGIEFSGNTSQNDPLTVTFPLLYYKNAGTSGAGYVNVTGGTFELSHNQALVFNTGTKSLSVISTGSIIPRITKVLLWKQITGIKGLWAFYYYSALNVDYEVCPGADGIQFSGNTSQNDPLTVTFSFFYYRNTGTSGAGYISKAGSTYTIGHNQALVFDVASKNLEVISIATVIPRTKRLLLWKHVTNVKGEWAFRYYNSRPKLYLNRVMSRQCEGYGYPDNSYEAVTAALNDGYPAIRISVALTSDNIWYCTHCYEIENNATSNCLSVNGEAYTSNVFINNSTSQFMDTLSYKGYAIPKLTDVLAFVSLYDVEVTLELKDDITTQGAQTLLNLIDYYRLKKVVLSGSTTQLQVFTAINTNLDISVIFHYSSANAQSAITTFSGNCKSLRFDCWYTDTIAQSDVTDVIHPDYTIKLGGGAIGRNDLLTYVPWADVCEYAGVYSAL